METQRFRVQRCHRWLCPQWQLGKGGWVARSHGRGGPCPQHSFVQRGHRRVRAGRRLRGRCKVVSCNARKRRASRRALFQCSLARLRQARGRGRRCHVAGPDAHRRPAGCARRKGLQFSDSELRKCASAQSGRGGRAALPRNAGRRSHAIRVYFDRAWRRSWRRSQGRPLRRPWRQRKNAAGARAREATSTDAARRWWRRRPFEQILAAEALRP
mmetsp:Transcript_96758/g.273382  ORF Transcript_96758/g.273382 Transcript_96758/m.273382 type:complete len:214 (+) Transcript_96758:563-1204(+)